jgi:DNA gyrase subunit A
MGRGARGVKGITLGEGDYVIGVAVVNEERKLLTITEGGLGKRTEFSDFREMKHRGGKGVTCHKLSEKTGKLASILTVSDNDDIMIITDSGTMAGLCAEALRCVGKRKWKKRKAAVT